MLRKIVHSLMALTLAVGLAVAPMQQAQAGHGRGIGLGIAAGIIGLGIIGAAASARNGYDYDDEPGCYRGRRICHWAHRHCFENSYGDYVCRGGDYICERPLICE